MSELSPRLALPFLQPAQAQKHVTHNEALERLDLLVQLVVQGFGAVTPPDLPQAGQIWALGAAPSGAWAGQGGALAAWAGGAWVFVLPQPGWRASLADAASPELRVFTDAGWQIPVPDALDNLSGLGVNTTHDATNRLAVAGAATLLSHAGAGHQLKINKADTPDTASLLFQTGWSGRAEMGTVGTDDFAIKVSADGAIWHDGLVVDRASGKVALPEGATIAGTEAYRRGNILGAVSQSGGVPTGAVLESGSNANGYFARYANGVQECWGEVELTFAGVGGGGYELSNSAEVIFPAAFVGADSGGVPVNENPNVSMLLRRNTAGPTTSNFSCHGGNVTNIGFTARAWNLNAQSGSQTRIFQWKAIGRWF